MRYAGMLIAVEDVRVSRRFYEEILGQKVKYDFGENVTFEGDFSIHLASHFSRLLDGKTVMTGGNAGELYFESDDVDAVAGRLKDQGVELVHDVREQPWRQRVVRFYDPDRHIVEVGESLEFLSYRLAKEGMETEEIAGTLSMPEEFVLQSIRRYESR